MGNNHALCSLAGMYASNGNLTDARDLLDYARTLQNGMVMRNFGLLFRAVGENHTARACFEAALRLGRQEAAFWLGVLYYDGSHGIERDYAKAVHYLEMAAEPDNALALNRLSIIYQCGGYGIEKDLDKASALAKRVLILRTVRE